MAELEIKPSAAAELRVLAVVMSGFAIAGTLGLLLIGGLKEFLTPKVAITTYMSDGTGLGPQSEVRLSGIRIGTVTHSDISGSLDPQRAVRVSMQISGRFLKSIPRDSQASVSADTLVGDRFVSIDEGKDPLPLPENGELRSQPLKPEADQADLIKALQTELRQVDTILAQIADGSTTIGQFVVGEKAYDDLLRQVTAFQSSLHSFADSTAGQILFSSDLYDRVGDPVHRLDRALQAIQRGEGAAGHVFVSDDQYNRFLRQMRDLRASIAKIGANAMARDEAGYQKAQALLRDADRMIDSMTRGEGSAARLLRDPQFYESLNGSVQRLQDFLKDFRENPRKYMRVKVR